MSGFNNPIIGGGGALVYPSIHSPDFVHLASGWTINKDGSAEFNSLTIRGTFDGTDFEINSSGAFFYAGTPDTGNLISSIASAAGTDPFGNDYLPGITSYVPGLSFVEMFQGELEFMSLAATTRIVQSAALALNDAVSDAGQPGLSMVAPSTGVGNPVGAVILKGQSKDGTEPAQVLIAADADPVPVTAALVEVQGIAQITAAASGGQVLTLQDTAGAPSNSILEIITALAGDNCLGARVSGDAFNRIKATTKALLFGSGSSTQDTQIYRSSAGVFGVDTLAANVGGSVETWHSLGTPGITGWTSDRGRFRFSVDGEVEFDIVLHSNGVAHASSVTTYPTTLPAAYLPAFNRAYPLGIDTNITAGDPFPRLFIGTTGTVKIAIPSVGAATTEISGNIRMPLD